MKRGHRRTHSENIRIDRKFQDFHNNDQDSLVDKRAQQRNFQSPAVFINGEVLETSNFYSNVQQKQEPKQSFDSSEFSGHKVSNVGSLNGGIGSSAICQLLEKSQENITRTIQYVQNLNESDQALSSKQNLLREEFSFGRSYKNSNQNKLNNYRLNMKQIPQVLKSIESTSVKNQDQTDSISAQNDEMGLRTKTELHNESESVEFENKRLKTQPQCELIEDENYVFIKSQKSLLDVFEDATNGKNKANKTEELSLKGELAMDVEQPSDDNCPLPICENQEKENSAKKESKKSVYVSDATKSSTAPKGNLHNMIKLKKQPPQLSSYSSSAKNSQQNWSTKHHYHYSNYHTPSSSNHRVINHHAYTRSGRIATTDQYSSNNAKRQPYQQKVHLNMGLNDIAISKKSTNQAFQGDFNGRNVHKNSQKEQKYYSNPTNMHKKIPSSIVFTTDSRLNPSQTQQSWNFYSTGSKNAGNQPVKANPSSAKNIPFSSGSKATLKKDQYHHHKKTAKNTYTIDTLNRPQTNANLHLDDPFTPKYPKSKKQYNNYAHTHLYVGNKPLKVSIKQTVKRNKVSTLQEKLQSDQKPQSGFRAAGIYLSKKTHNY